MSPDQKPSGPIMSKRAIPCFIDAIYTTILIYIMSAIRALISSLLSSDHPR